VVGARSEGPVFIWNDRGETVASFTPARSDRPRAVIDWNGERLVIAGERTIHALGRDGAVRFEVNLGDFDLAEVVTVAGAPGNPTLLALSGYARVEPARARLLLLDPSRAVVFDQIFGQYGRLLRARSADGHDTLFWVVNGLHALRRRR
jgi:hypothetical protein